ncbi:vicilin-like seed storage protein At2g18540 [Alosa alosa]|uniref:vicilin-like seed storage protein At2g18540 n=1 Tax=Alosa alosa TaxID=278164 RepID=UPI00201537E9|nr:vicilin-like seed storage protein At2g18540 [Alosa alosa]
MATGGTDNGFKLVISGRPVKCNEGDDVTLPCHLSPETSVVAMEIRWFRWTDVVYLYKNGDVIEGKGYEGKVSVDPQGLQRGGVSLRLRGCTWGHDKGVYTCQVICEGQLEETRVGLEIRRPKRDWHDPFEKDRMERTLRREITVDELEKMNESVRSVAPPAWWKATEELMKRNRQLEKSKKPIEEKQLEEGKNTLQEEDEQLEDEDLTTQLQEEERELEERNKQLEERDKQLEERESRSSSHQEKIGVPRSL